MTVRDAVINLDRVQQYPQQPSFDKSCYVNTNYDTLQDCYPRVKRNLGPASVLHIYPSRLSQPQNIYPNVKEYQPYNTMYGWDSSTYDMTPNSSGYGRRITYGFQAYPFSTRNVREINEYSTGKPIPPPNIERWQMETVNNPSYPPMRRGVWGR